MTNTRIGLLAAVEKDGEAATVADLIGGVEGALGRVRTRTNLSPTNWMTHLGDMAAAALAAVFSLRAARASGNRTMLVSGLTSCGEMARFAPGEMAGAERASREQERIGGSPVSYGGLDLSHEGRISLPTTPVERHGRRTAGWSAGDGPTARSSMRSFRRSGAQLGRVGPRAAGAGRGAAGRARRLGTAR